MITALQIVEARVASEQISISKSIRKASYYATDHELRITRTFGRSLGVHPIKYDVQGYMSMHSSDSWSFDIVASSKMSGFTMKSMDVFIQSGADEGDEDEVTIKISTRFIPEFNAFILAPVKETFFNDLVKCFNVITNKASTPGDILKIVAKATGAKLKLR